MMDTEGGGRKDDLADTNSGHNHLDHRHIKSMVSDDGGYHHLDQHYHHRRRFHRSSRHAGQIILLLFGVIAAQCYVLYRTAFFSEFLPHSYSSDRNDSSSSSS
ncbi:hypothetical protein U1Q18_039178, partial [Sarracenia purpurea var. burkii]